MNFLNVIIPLLAYEFSVVLMVFVLIVLIEALILSYHTGIVFLESLKLISTANVLSTIFGYIGLGILRLISFGSISLVFQTFNNPVLKGLSGNMGMYHFEYNPGFPIEIIVNFIFGFLLALLLSIIIEYRFLRKRIINKRLKKAIIICNIISYLLIYCAIIIGYSIIQKN